ncbi:MAG: hypothetical protein Fur0040_10470 [Sideroxydans sp.]
MLKHFGFITLLLGALYGPFAACADTLQEANQLFKQGQHAQALEKVNAVLASKPKDAQARFLKGLILNEQGNVNEAIKVFSALTVDYPELPEPYNNLAVLYASQGQYDKARSALEKAIRTHPSYATAHENLGDIYAKMASQAYDRALQLDQGNASTQTKLALIRDLFSKHPASKPASVQIAAAPATAAAQPAPVAPRTPVVPPSVNPPAASAPAVKAEPKPEVEVKPEAKSDIPHEVLEATRAWAAAWTSQNSTKYLAHYASSFETPDGMTRAAWEAQRRERIAKPKTIQIEVRDARVEVRDAQHAVVRFRQLYRASHLKSASRKTLLWVKEDGRWKIQRETTDK